MRIAITTALLTLLLSPAFGQEAAKAPAPAEKKAAEKPAAKPAPKKSAKSDGDLKVLTEAESNKRSSLLDRINGQTGDRYDATDWSEVPAWRQTTFFGIRTKGQTFVYVVDCSESMLDGTRLIRAKSELRKSVMSLQFPQRFKVIFYNEEPIPMPGGLSVSADLASKEQFVRWLRLIEPFGGTDPRAAMKTALGMKPDAVFLLSDGEFPEGTAAAIAAANGRKTPIHCIDLSGGSGGDQLKAIAGASGGKYVARP